MPRHRRFGTLTTSIALLRYAWGSLPKLWLLFALWALQATVFALILINFSRFSPARGESPLYAEATMLIILVLLWMITSTILLEPKKSALQVILTLPITSNQLATSLWMLRVLPNLIIVAVACVLAGLKNIFVLDAMPVLVLDALALSGTIVFFLPFYYFIRERSRFLTDCFQLVLTVLAVYLAFNLPVTFTSMSWASSLAFFGALFFTALSFVLRHRLLALSLTVRKKAAKKWSPPLFFTPRLWTHVRCYLIPAARLAWWIPVLFLWMYAMNRAEPSVPAATTTVEEKCPGHVRTATATSEPVNPGLTLSIPLVLLLCVPDLSVLFRRFYPDEREQVRVMKSLPLSPLCLLMRTNAASLVGYPVLAAALIPFLYRVFATDPLMPACLISIAFGLCALRGWLCLHRFGWLGSLLLWAFCSLVAVLQSVFMAKYGDVAPPFYGFETEIHSSFLWIVSGPILAVLGFYLQYRTLASGSWAHRRKYRFTKDVVT